MIDHGVWRAGCPVEVAELRLITMSYWGYDGAAHEGKLVVNVDAVDATVGAFRTLFEDRSPIERMELVDAYNGDDDASMAANNTSAFNCRLAPGTDVWSQHAYGRAIDINPLVNPEVDGAQIYPPEGAAYVDRSLQEMGMIHPGDAAVLAFDAVRWYWGGDWEEPKDYQHFSANGY
jgi:hypothetical protein